MAENEISSTYTIEAHALFMDERKSLIEAARESARTFDQAVLAFGSAVFAASIAFLKDVAPHPEKYSLKWLALSWVMFAVGLLAVLLSFLFSHKACMFEIDTGLKALSDQNVLRPKNEWSTWVNRCNYSCVSLLFAGLIFWSVFAFENLTKQSANVSSQRPTNEKVEEGYSPPKIPTPPPKQFPATDPARGK